MRHRTTRLGRWHRWNSKATRFILEPVSLVEAATLFTFKLAGLVGAFAVLTRAVMLVVSAIR